MEMSVYGFEKKIQRWYGLISMDHINAADLFSSVLIAVKQQIMKNEIKLMPNEANDWISRVVLNCT